MDNLQISDVKIVPCENSPYIQTSRVLLKQNGVNRKWDYIRVHDGVYIMVYNVTRDAFVLVKQFRPTLLLTRKRGEALKGNDLLTEDVQKVDSSLSLDSSLSDGVAYELCAGLVDKNISLIEIAKEELIEECGYNVPLECIRKVTAWRNELGHACNEQTLFYAEVTDDMLVPGAGGGNAEEGEFIETYYLPRSEVKTFIYDENLAKESATMFAFLWWLDNVQTTKI